MAQYGRPVADLVVGSWSKNGGGTPLYAQVDEVTPSDADYIWCYQSFNACELDITPSLGDPEVSTDHIIRFRCRSESGTPPVTCYLYQNTTLKATAWSGALTTSWSTKVYTLSGAEADGITDYTDLKFRIVTGSTSFDTVNVSWVELEIPDAAASGQGAALHRHLQNLGVR